jgi:hypothetical protein
MEPQDRPGSVDLYWLPLGAGGTADCVRLNGRLYEALSAWQGRRERCELYHSALQVQLGSAHFVIEMTPAWGHGGIDRGVVGEGAVGLPYLGRSRYFRYEVRRWRDGVIPDLSCAVVSPQRLSTNEAMAQVVLDLVPAFPMATWGRDEQHTGEMWNSNSLVSWLLARSGHDSDLACLPPHGRAPGWSAGLVVAARDSTLSGALTRSA